MRSRRTWWARAGMVAGVLALTPLVVGAQESAPAVETGSEVVNVLEARDAGLCKLDVRGQGEGRVALKIQNTTGKRLKVVFPPGLVASSAVAQPPGGGAFQSMGLGTPTSRANSFGKFAGTNQGGAFRSVPASGSVDDAVTVPAEESVTISIPAVCMNFGWPTPTARDRFDLVSVEEYTPDTRVRSTLKSLATMGTSLTVAQAAMWNVANGISFEEMLKASPKRFNRRELALASNFVGALERTGGDGEVDPSYLTEGRVYVRVTAQGDLADQASRLAADLEGAKVLGLPVRLVSGADAPTATGPALFLDVELTAADATSTSGRVSVSAAEPNGKWTAGTAPKLSIPSGVSYVDGAMLAGEVEKAVSRAFVRVKPVRRERGAMVVRVENQLPFTLSSVGVLANETDPIRYDRMGIAPGRSAEVNLQAAGAVVERVELNGL